MSLVDQAREQSWYHTLDLPGFTTHGVFDMRQYVDRYAIPADLTGMRVLEVGTWDGFWAFELEKRGAEVVAIDLDDEEALDWPPRRRTPNPDLVRGAGFRIAKELLGSNVERVVCSVYDALPEDLGQFDLVFCGSVLLHLRDQMLALERICNLVKPGGRFITAEEYEPITDLIPFPMARFRGNRDAAVVFWVPNRRGWRSMLFCAGFDRMEQIGTFTMKSNQGYGVRHVVHHAFKNA